jgi:hypothetical protein
MSTAKLKRVGEYVHAIIGERDVRVRLLWAKPVTGRGTHLSLLDEKKNEVAFIEDLAQLDSASRSIAEEALHTAYLIPKITCVRHAHLKQGTRFWQVETDHGERYFAVRDQAKNVSWLSEWHVLIRDVLGNRFEIPDLQILDAKSRKEMGKVL